MIYECNDCEARFTQMEQTISQHKFGQCPACLSENIREEQVKEDHDAK